MAFQLIEINDLNHIIIKVSEEIQGQYLSQFIKTALKEKGIALNRGQRLFYTYLNQSREYQISFFDSKSKHERIFLECITPKHQGYSLFFSKNFLIVYHNEWLYYYQAIDETLNVKDIQNYVEERLKIIITHTQEMPTNHFSKVESQSSFNRVNYCTQNRWSSFHFYLLYLLFVLLSTLGYIYYSNEGLSAMKLHTLQSQYAHLIKNKKFSKAVFFDTQQLCENITTLNLQLKNLEVKQGVFTVKVLSIEKNNLYRFLKLYEKKSLHQNIEFDSNEKRYVLYAKIQFN